MSLGREGGVVQTEESGPVYNAQFSVTVVPSGKICRLSANVMQMK